MIVTTTGKKLLLAYGVPALVGSMLRLFGNDHTPTESDTTDDYSEPTFPGYAPLQVASWTAPFVNEETDAESTAPPAVWTVTATVSPAQLVYGYFLTDQNGYLILAERYSGGPDTILWAGQVYALRPAMTLDDQN